MKTTQFNIENYMASIQAMSKKEESDFLRKDNFKPLVRIDN